MSTVSFKDSAFTLSSRGQGVNVTEGRWMGFVKDYITPVWTAAPSEGSRVDRPPGMAAAAMAYGVLITKGGMKEVMGGRRCHVYN